MRGCVLCGQVLLRKGRGRRPIYCSHACQEKAYRLRKAGRRAAVSAGVDQRRTTRAELRAGSASDQATGTVMPQGRVGLTHRASEVSELVAAGLTNREIADRLFLSERTVEWHVEQILNALGFNTRSQIAAWVGRTDAAARRRPRPRPRSNLPTSLTEFVGRRQEVAMLRRLLRANRLLTITGPGGIGKTRLALELASKLNDYPDGIWLCQLASLGDPARVSDALAQTLGLKDEAPHRLDVVRKHLRQRAVLLLLDNCEHVQTAAREVAVDLLSACPKVRVLATSRSPLGALGEAVWRVGSLDLMDAIRLLKQRVHAAAPDVNVETEAAAGICQTLDCVPLALELAAPKVRVLGLRELSDAVLTPGAQNPDGRHGSLETVADWSYRLLDTNEQWLFRRLGVFASSFDAADASALADRSFSAAIALAGLVEKSMLSVGRLEDGQVRYRVLEVLRPFARARLEESGELVGARLMHAERMVWLAERLDLQYDEGLPELSSKLAAMVDDVRAALQTLIALGPRRAAWMAAALQTFWVDTGRLQEGLHWINAALTAHQASSAERCLLLCGQASLLLQAGSREEAEEPFREASALAALSVCAPLRGDIDLAIAYIQSSLGDLAAAERGQRQAIEEFTRNGRHLKAARAMNHLALSLLFQQRFKEAKALAEASVTIRRRYSIRVQPALDTLGQALAMMGELDRARDCFLEAIRLGSREQDRVTVFYALHGLAFTSGLRGHPEDALRLDYCAQHLGRELSVRFDDPLAPQVRELVERLEVAVGQHSADALRIAAEALEPAAVLRLAEMGGTLTEPVLSTVFAQRA